MQRITRAAYALGIWNSRSAVRLRRTLVLTSLIAMGLSCVPAFATTLTASSVALSDPRPGQTGVNYTFTGSSVSGASVVRCVKVIWSTSAGNDVAPTGFSGASGSVNAASSTLINSSASGWSLAKSDGTSSSGQNNIYEYTNSTGVTPSTTTGATFVLSSITNSSVQDVGYFFQLYTYSNTDCVTTPVDDSVVGFINTNASLLSLTVDPTLTFTVSAVASSTSCNGGTTTAASTSTTIPFGAITSATNGFVCQDLAASTNATEGYTIYARYTAPPTNALSQTIADHTGSNAAPTTFSAAGTEAYGYTTSDATLGTGTANRFTNGGQKYAALTTSNAEVGYESAPVNVSHYFIGHQVGISNTTLGGIYTTTVIYTCTPVY